MTSQIEQEISEPLSLLQEFKKVTQKGKVRTKFSTERIEAFLPDSLRPIFSAAMRAVRVLPNTQENRDMVAFVRDEIYGVLPNYTAPATEEHAKGIFINERRTKLMMNVSHAMAQIRNVIQGLLKPQIEVLISNVKKYYSFVNDKGAVHLDPVRSAIGLNNRPIYDRELVGLIIREAGKIKSSTAKVHQGIEFPSP